MSGPLALVEACLLGLTPQQDVIRTHRDSQQESHRVSSRDHLEDDKFLDWSSGLFRLTEPPNIAFSRPSNPRLLSVQGLRWPPERPRPWKFVLRTLMIAIAFMALLLVNGILLMRLRGLQGQNTSTLVRLRGMETERETLTTIIRELRYKVDRQEQARRYLIPLRRDATLKADRAIRPPDRLL